MPRRVTRKNPRKSVRKTEAGQDKEKRPVVGGGPGEEGMPQKFGLHPGASVESMVSESEKNAESPRDLLFQVHSEELVPSNKRRKRTAA